jgi:hypothetical protein
VHHGSESSPHKKKSSPPYLLLLWFVVRFEGKHNSAFAGLVHAFGS